MERAIILYNESKIEMSKTKFTTCILLILSGSLCFWFLWPLAMKMAGVCHLELGLGRAEPVSNEELSQIYTVLQALVAIVSIGIAFVMYVLSKNQARDDDFNRLQMKELEHVFSVVDEWARLQDDLACDIDGKPVDGPFVVEGLAKKYRIPELQLLVRIHGNDEKDKKKAKAELLKVDAEFMVDFEKANLKPLANALFRVLNWSWAIVGSFERIYRRDKTRMRQIDEFQEKIIGIVRDYIGPDSQFVYGKYRHIKWNLDNEWPAIYRGERSADRMFVYERTLAKYVPSPSVARLQLEFLEERNKKLKLTASEKLSFPELWASLAEQDKANSPKQDSSPSRSASSTSPSSPANS